jgi:hypothetical protein
MPRKRVPERQRRRTYALLAQCVRSGALLPRPSAREALLPQHSQRRGALLPQLPQRQEALLPRHSQRRGALLPQLPQRQGFRPPTPTGPAHRAGRPQVDAHPNCNHAAR